ncbi:Hypothetical predicted protein [Pelobates cultripes]|uniref:Uncharacterized protein n=1 Tax=Pelobates cultripes TaxID=61616 RepID=A0AAD1TBD0_PELCU|nr:Hypothetical predicted protein [Pelobates cultripes]
MLRSTHKPAHEQEEAATVMPTPHVTQPDWELRQQKDLHKREGDGGTQIRVQQEKTTPWCSRHRHQPKDPITAIFERFWVKLQALLQIEKPHRHLLMRARAKDERKNGGPPQGYSKTHATNPHYDGPPGPRAERGAPQRPHWQSTVKRLPKRYGKTPRITPKELNLGHDGSQGDGLQDQLSHGSRAGEDPRLRTAAALPSQVSIQAGDAHTGSVQPGQAEPVTIQHVTTDPNGEISHWDWSLHDE